MRLPADLGGFLRRIGRIIVREVSETRLTPSLMDRRSAPCCDSSKQGGQAPLDDHLLRSVHFGRRVRAGAVKASASNLIAAAVT
jgi:hypothetical protein